ncbi:potassium channel family protein [Virgibacillus byunsanensis]|uniref:Potassium channel family protein n=1 Tax=Virgibacillus byunsanensis TaxID=570945 RepID=A0ABW3LP47_9BACI
MKCSGDFMGIELLKNLYFRIPLILRLLLTIFFLMFIFGIIIHYIEPRQFPTIFEGIWWAFVTGATVGYGDYVPLSTEGRIVAILLILSGGGSIIFYISTLSKLTVNRENDLSDGKVTFKGSDHIIFIGWNERTRQLIDMITDNNKKIHLVLIDNSLQNIPYKQYPLHFIKGDPTEDVILEKANIISAKRVIITADISKKERKADNFTILTIVTIRGNNKDIPIIAEILSNNRVDNAVRAGANTIIRSNDFMSTLLFHELLRLKSATPFEDVLQLLHSQQFCHSKMPEEFVNKDFLYVSDHFSKEQHLLIGLIRNKEWIMNPPLDFILEKGDILITLVKW